MGSATTAVVVFFDFIYHLSLEVKMELKVNLTCMVHGVVALLVAVWRLTLEP